MKNLSTAIYTKYNTSTTFKAALTGGFYYSQAPNGCSYPYAVYSFFGVTPEDTFSEEINDVSIQINIYSEKSSSTECFNLVDYCKSLFTGAVLTVLTHENVTLIKEKETPPMKVNDEWMGVLEFSCFLQE